MNDRSRPLRVRTGWVFIASALPVRASGTVMMFRSVGGLVVQVLLWPAVLTWLLLRLGRTRAVGE